VWQSLHTYTHFFFPHTSLCTSVYIFLHPFCSSITSPLLISDSTHTHTHINIYRHCQMDLSSDPVTLTFNTTRFGVKVADGSFDASTTIGEVHARLRKKLLKSKASVAAPVESPSHSLPSNRSSVSLPPAPPSQVATYLFLRNGTEAFIPTPEQTLECLWALYGGSRESRKLSVTIDTEVFSG